MSEFSIGAGWRMLPEADEIVTIDRLKIIGCIGVWSNALKRFPLPMYAVDGVASVTEFNSATRVAGLLPSERDPTHLMRGSWTSQVDIRNRKPYGEGEVYLGNANSPSDTWGYVFEDPLQFDPELELGFVYDSGDEQVLYEHQYKQGTGFLIYTEAEVIEALGRVHKY